MIQFFKNRQVLCWVLNDWANSAFATTVIAGFFPIFFKKYWSYGDDPFVSTAKLGMAVSLASVTLAFFAPLLGALADATAKKKRFLFAFTYLSISMTASMSWIGQGQWMLVSVIYALALFGFNGSLIFYDSLLPFVAKGKSTESVSSMGYSAGYLGGGLLFAVNVLMYQKPHLFEIPEGVYAVRASFTTVAVWWAVFTLPLFLFLIEPVSARMLSSKGLIKRTFSEVLHTLKKIILEKNLVYFLLAYWLYIDGVDTVIVMAVDYGVSIGFQSGDLISALLITQFVGFPAAIGFGYLGEKWDSRRAILLGLAVYVVVVLWAVQMHSTWEFYVLAMLIGLVQGGIQALSRSLYAQMIPPENAAEYFGFYNLIGKFAAIFGPLLVGGVGYFFSDSRVGISSIILLFILGGFLLTLVKSPSKKLSI